MHVGLHRGDIIAHWIGRHTVVLSLAYQRSERLLIVEVAETRGRGKPRLRQFVWEMPTDTVHWAEIDAWLVGRADALLEAKRWQMAVGLNHVVFDDERSRSSARPYELLNHGLYLPEEQCYQLARLVQHLNSTLALDGFRERCAYTRVDFDPETSKPRAALRPTQGWIGE